jgi:hypothetical protein
VSGVKRLLDCPNLNGTCRSPTGNRVREDGGSLFVNPSAQSRGTSTHGHRKLATYARTCERIFASSVSTSTEWTTCLIVEAYHLPPLAVGTSSSFNAAAMAL